MLPLRILCVLGVSAVSSCFAAELTPQMLAAFDRYVKAAEARVDERAQARKLWVDDSAERLKLVRGGGVAVAPLIGKGDGPLDDDALVHDWIGAAFVPGATLAQTLASVQDYDRNKLTHKPEVIDSKLLSHTGNDFRVRLRLMKKKVITVVLETEHDIRYVPVDATFAHSRSYSTRISEVQDPGTPRERETAPGHDHGFLWRLYSYWRFLERDGGVYIECQAISLTRDVPTGLGWLIEPIIRGLPRESLIRTLESTRTAIETRKAPGASSTSPAAPGSDLRAAGPGYRR